MGRKFSVLSVAVVAVIVQIAAADAPVERTGRDFDPAAVVVKFAAALRLAVAVEARPCILGLGKAPLRDRKSVV